MPSERELRYRLRRQRGQDVLRSFESVRIGLIVGVGGRADSDKRSIRHSDVVFSCPIKKESNLLARRFKTRNSSKPGP